jgi:hypothetical protein
MDLQKKEQQDISARHILEAHQTQLALDLHRRFLQEVLADVLPLLSTGERSAARLVRALDAYWEACFARRTLRKQVSTLAFEKQLASLVEPLGRPFFHMILSELWATDAAGRNALAALVYNEARAVAVSEATFDRRMPEMRESVIQHIGSGAREAA